MVKKSFLTICFIFAATVLFAGPNYHKPVGHVNDFANIMSAEAKQQLESQLRDYRDKTSIELAVVTVPSLEDLTVEDYTLGLAQSWGVGDKKKSNGIVLLIAPNERKMRIEVGYGMEPDLTDAQGGRIIRDVIIPYFKESVQQSNDTAKNAKLTEGIIAGVNAILAGLGNTPFEARLEERKIAAEKAAAKQKLQDEKIAAFVMVAGLVALFITMLVIIAWLIYKAEARRKHLKNLYDKNGRDLKKSADMIGKAKQEYPKANDKLEQFKKSNPKETWQDLDKILRESPASIESYSKRLDQLVSRHEKSNWNNSEILANHITALIAAIAVYSEILETITAKIKETDTAKANSSKLIDSVQDAIKATRKELDDKDVKDKSRKYLDQADNKHKKAKELADNQSVNWLVVVALLTEAMALVANAKSQAKSDKENAEEERHPKPRRSSDDSYSSPSYSSSSNWSSSDSSSSSSGFGGGGFGGGGASGSW